MSRHRRRVQRKGHFHKEIVVFMYDSCVENGQCQYQSWHADFKRGKKVQHVNPASVGV